MAKAKAKKPAARARAGRKAPPKVKAKAKPPEKKKPAAAKRRAATAPTKEKRAAGKRTPIPSRKSPRKRVQAPRVSRQELERRLAAARAGAQSLTKQWLRGLERMRDHLSEPIGRELVLRAVPPPPAAKGTPWVLVGRFAGFDGLASYSELYLGLLATRDDDLVERDIGRQRLCRIAVRYDGVEVRGGRKRVERDFTLANIAPWEVAISRAVERCDPESEEGLVAAYDQGKHRTLVRAVYVWISAEEASAVDL